MKLPWYLWVIGMEPWSVALQSVGRRTPREHSCSRKSLNRIWTNPHFHPVKKRAVFNHKQHHSMCFYTSFAPSPEHCAKCVRLQLESCNQSPFLWKIWVSVLKRHLFMWGCDELWDKPRRKCQTIENSATESCAGIILVLKSCLLYFTRTTSQSWARQAAGWCGCWPRLSASLTDLSDLRCGV